MDTTPIFVNFLPGAGGNFLIRLLVNILNPNTYYFVSSHGGCHAAGTDDNDLQGHVFTPPDGHREKRFIDLLWERRSEVFDKRGNAQYRIIPIHCTDAYYAHTVFPNAKQIYIYLDGTKDYIDVDVRHVYKNHMETYYWVDFHNAVQNFKNELIAINSEHIPADTSIWDLTKQQFDYFLEWRIKNFYSDANKYKRLDIVPPNTIQIAFNRLNNDPSIVDELAEFVQADVNNVARDLFNRYSKAQINLADFKNLLKD